jgi:hypothetical protein
VEGGADAVDGVVGGAVAGVVCRLGEAVATGLVVGAEGEPASPHAITIQRATTTAVAGSARALGLVRLIQSS